jgi:hypothetical protein
MTTKKIKWFNPTGGALIVLPKNVAMLWGGIEDNDGKDYDFACSFSDYTSVTKYKEAEIIILGDESLMTGIIQKGKRSIFIIRWVYADTESHIIDLIEHTDFNHIPNCEAHRQIFFATTDYVLFDSVDKFENISEYLTFIVESGVYSIDTYEIGNETTKVIVDRVMKRNEKNGG